MVGPTTLIVRISVVALLALVQACGGAANLSPTGASPSPSLEPTPSIPADAAPEALQGRWSTVMGPGDSVMLIIGQTGYSISRGGASGHGQISVHGDQIQFSRVQSCPDVTGTYRWKLSGETLTFTAVGPDLCPRAFVLKDREYKRLAS